MAQNAVIRDNTFSVTDAACFSATSATLFTGNASCTATVPAGTVAVQEALPVNSVAEVAEKHAASVTEKVLSLMTAFCAMGQKPVLSVAEQGRSRTNSQ